MGQRLLVVAPHPDDESLGAAGLMAKAAGRGDEVYVALLSSGDGFKEDATRYYLSLDVTPEEYWHMGYERQMETQRAMAELGVPAPHVYFLGFPDGGLDTLWRTHWDGDPLSSPTTGYDHVPYLTAWRPDVPYHGKTLLGLLLEVLEEVKPDRLVLPSAFDTHPDHWAANAFATLAWAVSAQRNPTFCGMERLGYLVHWPTWPMPLNYRPQMPLEAPLLLLRAGEEPWHSESIAPAEVEKKRCALMAHASQAELIKPFMLAFCRSTEVFSRESGWTGRKEPDGVAVRNPGSDLVSRALGRQNPLVSAVWSRGESEDGVTVLFSRRDGSARALEVSLTAVDDPVHHYQWMVERGSALPDGVRAVFDRDAVRVFWPREWIGGASVVMAGVQAYRRGRCEGKIPFRPVVWPHDNQRGLLVSAT